MVNQQIKRKRSPVKKNQKSVDIAPRFFKDKKKRIYYLTNTEAAFEIVMNRNNLKEIKEKDITPAMKVLYGQTNKTKT